MADPTVDCFFSVQVPSHQQRVPPPCGHNLEHVWADRRRMVPSGARRHLCQFLQLGPVGPADRAGQGVHLCVQHRQPGSNRRPPHPAPPGQPAQRQALRVHHGGHG